MTGYDPYAVAPVLDAVLERIIAAVLVAGGHLQASNAALAKTLGSNPSTIAATLARGRAQGRLVVLDVTDNRGGRAPHVICLSGLIHTPAAGSGGMVDPAHVHPPPLDPVGVSKGGVGATHPEGRPVDPPSEPDEKEIHNPADPTDLESRLAASIALAEARAALKARRR